MSSKPGTGPVKKAPTGRMKKRGSAPLGHPVGVKDALSFGVEKLKAHVPVLVPAVLIMGIVSGLIQQVAALLGPLGIVTLPISIGVSAFLGANLMQIALDIHDGRPAELAHLFNKHPQFVPFLIASAIAMVAVSFGMMLLVVPGLLAAAVLMFAPMLVVDKRMAGLDAVKHSVALAKPHLKELVVFMLAIMAVNFAGALLLGIGMLATIPITMMAVVHMYRAFEAA